MTDPEALLRSVRPEHPPPELALAAVRAFRYRAVATIAAILAFGAVSFVVVDKVWSERANFFPSTEGFELPILQETEVDGARVTLLGVIVDERNGSPRWARILIQDPKGRQLRVRAAVFGFGDDSFVGYNYQSSTTSVRRPTPRMISTVVLQLRGPERRSWILPTSVEVTIDEIEGSGLSVGDGSRPVGVARFRVEEAGP